jgi:hypothetical protein
MYKSCYKLSWENLLLLIIISSTVKFLCVYPNRVGRRKVLRIRYVYPGSDFFPSRIPDPNFSIPDPGFAFKNLSILTKKNYF